MEKFSHTCACEILGENYPNRSNEIISDKRDHYGRARIYVRGRVAGRCVALGI